MEPKATSRNFIRDSQSMATLVIVSVLAVGFLDEKMVWIKFVGAGLILLSGVARYLSDIAYQEELIPIPAQDEVLCEAFL